MKLFGTTLTLAGLIFLGASPVAHATLTLTATETAGPTLTVVDNGPGDTNPAIGNITLANGTIFGDFTVNGSVSTSNAIVPGSGPISQVATSSLNVINNTTVAHTINLQVSDTSFTFPGPPVLLSATASGTFSPNVLAGGTNVGGATANALAFGDNTNTLFGHQTTVLNATFGPAPNQSSPISYSFNSGAGVVMNFTAGTGYSMTDQLIFTVPGLAQLNGRSNVVQGVGVVPEPATIAMAFSGLPVLGLFWARRRRQQAV